jgi:alkylhydroperoxidase family enzyme
MRRIPGLPPKQWPRELLAAGAALRAPEGFPMAPIASPSGTPRGMGALETFAHHPALAQAFFPFNGHVQYGTTLAPRQRGLLVLRVGVLRQSTYLWTQHVLAGRELGLTDADIANIAFGPNAPTLAPLDAALVRAVDELIGDGVISDATWAVLAADLDHRQLLDVIFTVGCFETVSFMMRSVNLELDQVALELLGADRTPTRNDPEGTTP